MLIYRDTKFVLTEQTRKKYSHHDHRVIQSHRMKWKCYNRCEECGPLQMLVWNKLNYTFSQHRSINLVWCPVTMMKNDCIFFSLNLWIDLFSVVDGKKKSKSIWDFNAFVMIAIEWRLCSFNLQHITDILNFSVSNYFTGKSEMIFSFHLIYRLSSGLLQLISRLSWPLMEL